METKIGIKIDVDASGSIKTMGELEKEVKDFNKELEKTATEAKGINNVEKAFEDLNKQVESNTMSQREMAKAIKQYQTIALQAGETSPIGQDAIKKAAQLRDRLGDLNNAINTNAHDGANMQAALQLGSSVTAGYGVAQGAMALLGTENEKLMESMVKLQAATSVLTGLEQIRASLEKESFLMIKAKALQTNLLSIATAGYSAVVGTTTGAVKLFRLALISTGIGAIIVGLGLLVANMDKVAAAFQWVGQKALEAWDYFRGLGTGIKILLSIMFPFVGVIWAVTEALEAMGVVETLEEKKARQVIEAKMKVATQAHNKRVDELHKQMEVIKAAAAAEKEATDSIIKGLDREIELRKAAGEETEELEKQKLGVLVQSARVQYNLSKSLIELQNAELFARREHQIELAKIQGKNTANLEAELMKEKRIKAIRIEEDLKEQKDALDEALHQQKLFHLEAETARREANKGEEKEQQNNIERVKIKVENINTANKMILASTENLNKKLEEADQEKIKRDAKRDKEAFDRKIANIEAVDNAASKGFDFLLNLNAAFGKNSEKAAKRDFQLNKAKNLAEAGADGTKAVLSTFANTPTGLGGKIAAATLAGLFAASNIARIAATQFNGASGGGGGVSLPSTSAGVGGADVGTITNTTTTIGGSSQVYVLEQDISSTQNKVQVLENQAKL
jgi:hypothetical protein